MTDPFESMNASNAMASGQAAVSASRFARCDVESATLWPEVTSVPSKESALQIALDRGVIALDWVIVALHSEDVALTYKWLRQQTKTKAQEALSKGLQRRFEVVTVNDSGKVICRVPRSTHVFREWIGTVALDLVPVTGRCFLMGAFPKEKERRETEIPQHQVKVSSFWMGQYPVTQSQYMAVMGDNPSRFKGADRPVERVTWYQALEFCKRLSEQTGNLYRLPSEAEWEYACRAGTVTPFHIGDVLTTDFANYNGKYTYGLGPKGSERKETTQVGQFVANAFGLYDMHGNVWEWCLDQWHWSYQSAPTDGSAWITGGLYDRRVIRGGSWHDTPRNCRSACRGHQDPNTTNDLFGFRVVSVKPLIDETLEFIS